MEGMWLHDSPPPSELRRKDNFLEYLRRYLSSCTLVDIELDQSDRICRLNYQKFGQLQSLLLFWKARKLYFIHYFKESPDAPYKLLLSWRGKASLVGEDIDNLYVYFDEVGRRGDMKHDFSSPKKYSMAELLEQEMNAAALKTVGGNPNFLQRKKQNIEEDIRKNQQWEKLQAILDKGEDLDVYELKVGDHKIKFEGELNPYERRNLLFQKIKKLKRGENILNERLESLNQQLEEKSPAPKKESTIPIVKPVWGKEENLTEEIKSPSVEATDYRIFRFDQFQVGVGLTARGNDQLRSKWASKEDVWVHLDGNKSAHAIIKAAQADLITPEALHIGATIVAHFSHFTADWIPVIYTQVKNLKGVTGAPGMVIYKKEKHLRCPLVNVEGLKE
jgi:predicted ribosome quality control (RQC) complex YloA/Tae2 family protein